ncbi:DUF4267 domain-containing protein [Kutzneria viridogrisea]|uniref:Uncharacterized protein n=2 Tax=Kutzneria TaxID=43356 RepID=W5WGY2_9PSEU|nr:DUF4267 domain-containing protein [Kutzneria albida]AHI00006.1 hypothetical protein KALB_6646 [Kutzneria albida DSM 43870]MBA8925185.1 hypothetical protein [Kutzneria viridogrisea]
MTYVAIALAVVLGMGIIVLGARYLLAPEGSARGLGLRSLPTGPVMAWLNLKGVRDIVCGLALLVILATGQLQVLGWFVLAAALIAVVDALVVLWHGGKRRFAYGLHGGTAGAMAVVSVGLLLS